MPTRDLYHNVVKTALVKDGWRITHDPLTLQWGKKDLFVDLGAEELLAAEKEGRKIAVEVKSFLGKSEIADLEQALGQYILYRNIMEFTHPGRELYLAVREIVFTELFEEPVGRILLDRDLVQLIVFDDNAEEILRWIP
ncbi:MAG: fatty-acid synthase [bacterium]|nr:fatty-acid synthase [bacterium]